MSTIAPTAAPQPVRTSYLLYVVSAVISIVGFVVSLIVLPATLAAAERQITAQGSTNGVDVHSIVVGSAIGGAVFGGLVAVAFLVLTIVFARKMLAGRNWARIVLTVFAALHIVGVFGAFGQYVNPISSIIAILLAVVSIVALVLSWLPDSNAFFRAAKAARPVA